jgi:hypothetical protein
MAIATGTALLLGAGLGAAGKIGGAALASRGQGKATEAGLEANREALQFSREQAARAEDAYRARWDAWNAGRNALLERYGIDIAPPDMGGGALGEAAAVPGLGPTTAAGSDYCSGRCRACTGCPASGGDDGGSDHAPSGGKGRVERLVFVWAEEVSHAQEGH